MMIPNHKIFHTALFLFVFLKFVVCPVTNCIKYEHIKKNITVNKSLEYSDKDSTLKSLYVSNDHLDVFILKSTSAENYLHHSTSDIFQKNLIQISSRLLL